MYSWIQAETVTLQAGGSNKRFEFRKNERPGDDREALAKKASDLLGVDCVWLSKFYVQRH
jgi:hypothetical protein